MRTCISIGTNSEISLEQAKDIQKFFSDMYKEDLQLSLRDNDNMIITLTGD